MDKTLHDLLTTRIYRILSRRPNRAIEVSEPYVVGSTTGTVRSKNEDIAAVVVISHPRDPARDYQLAVLCDGMGGMADGRHAATLAVSNFIATTIKTFVSRANPLGCLKSALFAAQEAVYRDLRGHGGATLSAVLMPNSGSVFSVHVGDSRIYGITREAKVEQLTRDDTLGAVLNRPDNKRPDSNRLIQFVGLDGELEPQLQVINRTAFEALLITSDGAHSAPTDVFGSIVDHSKGGHDLVRKLLNVADALGGLDNATVVHVPTALTNGGQVKLPLREGPETLLATLVSVAGEHDIWFEHMPAAEAAGNEKLARAKPAERTKPKVTKKRKQAKQVRPDLAGELPLEGEKPVAKLDFSDKEEG